MRTHPDVHVPGAYLGQLQLNCMRSEQRSPAYIHHCKCEDDFLHNSLEHSHSLTPCLVSQNIAAQRAELHRLGIDCAGGVQPPPPAATNEEEEEEGREEEDKSEKDESEEEDADTGGTPSTTAVTPDLISELSAVAKLLIQAPYI
jgi:hypothetical protein